MALDLSSLKKALTSLETALSVVCSAQSDDKFGTDAIETMKAGVIQNFEFTYELCWKFVQRWIRTNKTPEDAEPRTRKDLFRLAARYGLIEDPTKWFEYGEARNITAHTYDRAKADIVYEVAIRFRDDARYLLSQLEELND